MNSQYRKNLKDVATACKNYTDTQIAQAKEEIYWHIGEYSVTTSDDNTSAMVKTVPSNATRCKIKRVYGNTQKLNPTTASDSTSAMVKTMPSTVYDFDVSKVEGNSEKSSNLMDSTFIDNITLSITDYHTLQEYGLESNTDYTLSFENLTSNLFYYRVNWSSSNYTSWVRSDNSLTFNTATYEQFSITSDRVYDSSLYNLMLNSGSSALPYQPYFDGIHNFAWNGVKVEGANIWDEQWELGSISTTNGTNVISDTQIRAKNQFRITPNTTYYFKGTSTYFNAFYYDINGNFISYSAQVINNTFTTPNNAYYMRFNLLNAYGTTYNNDICINLSGSANGTYQPYITPTTLPIDLSTILYNGSPLFEENALKGVGTAKDYITPYKAVKVMGRVDLGSLSWTLNTLFSNVFNCDDLISVVKKPVNASTKANILMANYTTETSNVVGSIDMGVAIGTDGTIYVHDNRYSTAEAFKTAMSGVFLYYELATPIEVSINWASTLRGITGYANGTITLLNTNNMDSANTITYNSIIKENCCAKMVQSRNGSAIKTINFPTQTSDGYSAGSVANVRDFTINKRGTNVDKTLLGNYNYSREYNEASQLYRFLTPFAQGKIPSTGRNNNVLSAPYHTAPYGTNEDLIIFIASNGNLYVYNDLYTDTTTFKTAMANESLYYELADNSKTETDITPLEENVIVVQAGDTLSFYDSEDNLVTVPTDLTYRIEVAN